MKPATSAAGRQSVFLAAEVASYRDRWISGRNVAVVYWTGDALGKTIAEYYASVRNVPADRVFAWDFTWTPGSTILYTALESSFAAFSAAINALSDEIFAVLLVGNMPTRVQRTIGDSQVFSLSYILQRPYAVGPVGEGSGYTNGDGVATANRPRTVLGTYARIFEIGKRYWSQRVFLPSKVNLQSTQSLVGGWPLDRKAQMQTLGFSDTDILWRAAFVCQINAPIIEAGDPAGSREAVMRRIIDDSIAAEAARYTSWGNVILQGSSSSGPVAKPTKAEAYSVGYPLDANGRPIGFQWKDLAAETVTSSRATTPPDNYGASDANYLLGGATTFRPGDAGFVSQSDVMLLVLGTEAYHSAGGPGSANPPRTYLPSDFNFRRGAIATFSQSYGSSPPCENTKSWHYGPATWIAQTGRPAVLSTGQGYISCLNGYGATTSPVRIESSNATPTIDVNAGTQVVTLRESGVSVATASIGGMTPAQACAAIRAVMPAGWIAGVRDGSCESRAVQAIRCGAVAACGVWNEPGATYDPSGQALFGALWCGQSMAEWWFTRAVNFGNEDVAITSGWLGNPVWYCDPLYRPFGHLWS